MSALAERVRLMVKTFRKESHRVLPSERTTVHGADSMLMVLQLAMAQVNKQSNKVLPCGREFLDKVKRTGKQNALQNRQGEFKVDLSDVLMAWKLLLLDKLHLAPPGAPHLENSELFLEAYRSFLKRSNTVDLTDVLAMNKKLRATGSDPEEPVSAIQLFEFLSGNMETPDLPDSSAPLTPSGQSRRCRSQINMTVRRVFCSYLSLLVNSKDDLALTFTLNVPCRSLQCQAFTDIKHAARHSQTSLFLAVTSFVRAIQLGGKGYAPAESDPLRKHFKGLSDYVQFMDNLEEILGEIPDPSECGARLLAAIRAALVKGRGSEDPVYAAAEETTKELKERIVQLHQTQKQTANVDGTGISPARPKAYAVNHATAYGGRETVKVLIALLDEEAVTPPCGNKADLLSEDQPVLSGDEGTCVLTLFRSPEVSSGCSPEPLRNRVQSRLNLLKPKASQRVIRSQFACTYNDEPPLNRVLDFPSASQMPTCVHPAPKPRTGPTVADGFNPDAEDTAVSAAKPCSESRRKERFEVKRGVAPKQRSGNAQNGGGCPSNKRKTGIQMQSKGNKRKQLDSEQHTESENEPPEKKQHTRVSVKVPGKNACKASNTKKLIAGQGKLTSFFRV